MAMSSPPLRREWIDWKTPHQNRQHSLNITVVLLGKKTREKYQTEAYNMKSLNFLFVASLSFVEFHCITVHAICISGFDVPVKVVLKNKDKCWIFSEWVRLRSAALFCSSYFLIISILCCFWCPMFSFYYHLHINIFLLLVLQWVLNSIVNFDGEIPHSQHL